MFITAAGEGTEEGSACDSLNANDYSSWDTMASNGWSHETSGDAHLSDMTHSGVANSCQEGSNWFGWDHNPNVGVLSYTMPAAGTGTVDFGNCWNTPNSWCVLYIGGEKVGWAEPMEQHVISDIVFQAGDVLELKDEGANSVCKLSSLDLTCTGDGAACPETTTVTVVGSTATEMDSNGACCCCGQPRWFELAELKLFNMAGENVAPIATAVDLLLEPSNPDDVGVITDGDVFDWSSGKFVVWQNSHNFHGESLVRLTFSTPQVIVGAELYSTNYESFGTNAKVMAGSRSLPTRFVYNAHENQGAAHAKCYAGGQEYAAPCSTIDGEPPFGSAAACAPQVTEGFGSLEFNGQTWYLVRRDHSVEGGWHPVNDGTKF